MKTTKKLTDVISHHQGALIDIYTICVRNINSHGGGPKTASYHMATNIVALIEETMTYSVDTLEPKKDV